MMFSVQRGARVCAALNGTSSLQGTHQYVALCRDI